MTDDIEYDEPAKIIRALLGHGMTQYEAIERLEILISNAAEEAADHAERAANRE